jgi:hypothetical protein
MLKELLAASYYLRSHGDFARPDVARYIVRGKSLSIMGFAVVISALIIGMLILNRLFMVSFWDIQSLKFPPQFGYLLYSGISVAVCLLFSRTNMKAANPLVWVGKNCLWKYAGRAAQIRVR